MARANAKDKVFKFHIINIKLESPKEFASEKDKYRDLIQRVKNAKIFTKLRGDRYCIMRTLFHDGDDIYNFHGQFVSFIKIDSDQFFNMDTMEIEEGLNLTDNVFPNPKEIDFYFCAEYHRMVVRVGDKISLNSIAKHIDESFQRAIDIDETVTVIVQQSQDIFHKIIQAPFIKKLEISITPTNSDPITEAFEEMFDDDVKVSEIKRMDTSFWAKNGKTAAFSKSKIVKAQLSLAEDNGKAKAVIFNEDGDREGIDTSDHPAVYSMAINSYDELTWKVAEYVGARYERKTQTGQV